MSAPSHAVLARLARLRLFAMDVDGVLTDGSIILGENIELKRFHVRDGLGLKRLAEAGIILCWITARSSEAVRRRARELGCVHLLEGVEDKAQGLTTMAAQHRVALEDCAYMGDDLNDLPAMRLAGCPLAPADAVPDVRQVAVYVTKAAGGRGAVREVCDLWLDAVTYLPGTPPALSDPNDTPEHS